MNRQHIWPDFKDAWIVHEDLDIVVVNKPVGVSSQSADPERLDDVVTRLGRHLANRSSNPYLGVHQRLDKDTSGLLVFARRREANTTLASQFEGRAVAKTYLAGVTGWRGSDRATLRHAIVFDRDGRTRVVSARSPGSKEAVTLVRVLGRKGDRALLELVLKTGRTHQARVQLAHAGSPIAGDALYGGARAPRLLLHASALAFVHPDGRHVRFEAKVPPEFASWLDRGFAGDSVYDDDHTFAAALDQAVERRWALGRADVGPRATTAFRLLNEDGDGTPGLAVDVYGEWLVAQLYGDDGPWADRARRERVLDRLFSLGFEGIYLKVRPKQANVVTDTHREDIAPRLPVRGTPAPEELAIVEEGTPLLVRLGDGLSTGLFLDQRANRRRVRDLAAGKSVANLFAYTCAFTVVAALAGAERTVSVDAAAAALERGRRNLENAGVLGKGRHDLVAGDVFAWLARARGRGERFDFVIVDPPTYSTSKRGRFVAATDYVDLAAAALGVVEASGQLLACTNHRGTSRAQFRRTLFEAARKARREVAQVKDLSPPQDFPEALDAEPHTKSALMTLRS